MNHHVHDIEQLREHLGIARWIVFGLSWGSVLALTYAERHPERVTAVVAGAVSTGTRAEIDWLTVHAGRFFPAEWDEFRDHVPSGLRDLRLVDAYNRLLMDPDPAVHNAAARHGVVGRMPTSRLFPAPYRTRATSTPDSDWGSPDR